MFRMLKEYFGVIIFFVIIMTVIIYCGNRLMNTEIHINQVPESKNIVEIDNEPEMIIFEFATTGEWHDEFRPQIFLKITDTDLSKCFIDGRLRLDLNGEIYWIRLEKDG